MELTTLINHEFLNSGINFFTALISAIFAYIGTRYVIMKPKKLEIAEKRLEKVYLPLYKIFFFNTEKISKEYLLKKRITVLDIVNNNCLYTFPKLREQILSLYECILIDEDYEIILNGINYQISIELEELKRILGYPSESAFQLFRRKTRRDKISAILAHINIFIFLGMLFFFSYYVDIRFSTSLHLVYVLGVIIILILYVLVKI